MSSFFSGCWEASKQQKTGGGYEGPDRWLCKFRNIHRGEITWSSFSTAGVDYRLPHSQSETSLQSNAVSHWLGANLESAMTPYTHPVQSNPPHPLFLRPGDASQTANMIWKYFMVYCIICTYPSFVLILIYLFFTTWTIKIIVDWCRQAASNYLSSRRQNLAIWRHQATL